MHKQEPWGGSIANDIDAFVAAAVQLYNDEERWNKAQANGTALLHARYDSKLLGEKLIRKIVEVEENLEEHRLNNFTGAMLKHHSMKSTKYMSQWIAEKNRNSD